MSTCPAICPETLLQLASGYPAAVAAAANHLPEMFHQDQLPNQDKDPKVLDLIISTIHMPKVQSKKLFSVPKGSQMNVL